MAAPWLPDHEQRPSAAAAGAVSYCYLLDADADLAEEFDIRMRMVARRAATVVVFEIPVGDCDPAQWTVAGDGAPGLLCSTGSSPSTSTSATAPPPSSWAPATSCSPGTRARRAARALRLLARAPAGARRGPRRRLRRAHPPVAADPARAAAPCRQARERSRRPARDRVPAAPGGAPDPAPVAPGGALGQGRAWRDPHLAAPHPPPDGPARRRRAPVGLSCARAPGRGRPRDRPLRGVAPARHRRGAPRAAHRARGRRPRPAANGHSLPAPCKAPCPSG